MRPSFRSGGEVVTKPVQVQIADMTARLVLRSRLAAAPVVLVLPLAALGQAPVSRWDRDSLGNHRAIVQVDLPDDALRVRIDWRRRDPFPDSVAAIFIDAQTGRRVRNVARMQMAREAGDFVFQPPSRGRYYVYYMPYTGTPRSNYPRVTYRKPDDAADPNWLLRHALSPGHPQRAVYQQLPAAVFVGLESVDPVASFTPMEVIASQAELDAMLVRYAWAEYFLFPEGRDYAIRMAKDIPQRWAQRGPFQALTARAKRGEYFTFQIGVWAHRAPLPNVKYRSSAFVRRGRTAELPATVLTCFNLEGTDWAGQPFQRALRVERGQVQALWFGLDLDERVAPGLYEGDVTISADGVRERTVRVVVDVEDDTLARRGDDEPQRLTRLRWLNSQMGVDDALVAPYTPMRVEASVVHVLGRTLTLGRLGLPSRITSTFSPSVTTTAGPLREVLAAPIVLRVQDEAGRDRDWTASAPRFTKQTEGAVEWQDSVAAGALSLATRARMEFDGTAEFQMALRTTERTTIGDVRLEVPLRLDAARYMMGLGQKGGRRPPTFQWTWDVATKNQDAVWLGDVNAGLHVTLKDERYVRPLNTNFYLSKPLVLPRSWGNDGKGGCRVSERAAESREEPAGQATRPRPGAQRGAAPTGPRPAAAVVLACYSGGRTLDPGDSLRFDFRLAVTPFKTIDTDAQWATRFYHRFTPVDSIAARGANTVNVHHANRVNPWINYPFLEPAAMKAYIDSAHARSMRVKIYYTVRELTNRAPELFMLRSLGDEVLARGPGGGHPWLQEHVGSDYIAGWHVPENGDVALVTSGVSRWHNFYVEGLNWLVRQVGIDGLYIDDVAFDRRTMQRVRKVLLRGNPSALVDLHSANQYNPRDGFASSANLYLEHFPFIDRLWFGEYFDYDSSPDYWLVELSGIPFGLMGEMLEKGGNPWRGMTFGMTNRLPWAGDPSPLWKVWDTFGMRGSRMAGWWVPTPPVRTNDASVLATTYLKPGRALISLGNWADRDVPVRLSIDWRALGIDAARGRVSAPAIEAFQPAGSWAAGAAITIPAKKGLLLIVD